MYKEKTYNILNCIYLLNRLTKYNENNIYKIIYISLQRETLINSINHLNIKTL